MDSWALAKRLADIAIESLYQECTIDTDISSIERSLVNQFQFAIEEEIENDKI